MKRWLQFVLLLVGVPAFGYAPEPRQLLSAHAYEPNSALRLNENLDYTYDASHNLATRTANTLTQTFTSDAANQLASITRSGTLTVSGSITGAVATLGVNGKAAQIYSDGTFATTEALTLRDGNNMLVTAGSNSSGALVLSTISSNRLPVTVSFGYDLNGNLTSDGQRMFEYDDANQLVSVTASNFYRTEFSYDGLGRRRIVREYTWSSGNWQSAGETRYVCDGYLPVQERDANGNVLVTYTRGPDLSGTFGGAGGIGGLLARTDSSGSAFYHADVAGNITSLIDSSGNAVARYLHDPFGRALGMSGPLGGPNVMRSASMPYYERADVIGYAFRLYGPGLHRWLTQDPIGEAGGINLYGLVGNNPINYIDPMGLQIGAGYGTMPLPHFPENNDPPPTWVTLLPIAGSGAQASYDFKQGNWGWGMFNLGLAAADIVPVRSATTGLAKGGWKFGSHTWDAVRKWLTRKGWRECPGQPVHHWGIPREGWGSNIPDWLKNQPWNIMGVPDREFHNALHGVGRNPFTFGERLWYGTPDWLKAGAFSFGGREANWMFNPGSFTAPSDGGAIFPGPVPWNP